MRRRAWASFFPRAMRLMVQPVRFVCGGELRILDYDAVLRVLLALGCVIERPRLYQLAVDDRDLVVRDRMLRVDPGRNMMMLDIEAARAFRGVVAAIEDDAHVDAAGLGGIERRIDGLRREAVRLYQQLFLRSGDQLRFDLGAVVTGRKPERDYLRIGVGKRRGLRIAPAHREQHERD